MLLIEVISHDVQKKKGVKEQRAQSFGQFCQWLCMIFGEGFFYSCGCPHLRLVNLSCHYMKRFLTFIWHFSVKLLPQGDRLIYSSIIETKKVQRLVMKGGSNNLCLLSCQFNCSSETCKHRKEKSYVHTIEAYEEYFETLFFGWECYSEFNYGHSL